MLGPSCHSQTPSLLARSVWLPRGTQGSQPQGLTGGVRALFQLEQAPSLEPLPGGLPSRPQQDQGLCGKAGASSGLGEASGQPAARAHPFKVAPQVPTVDLQPSFPGFLPHYTPLSGLLRIFWNLPTSLGCCPGVPFGVPALIGVTAGRCPTHSCLRLVGGQTPKPARWVSLPALRPRHSVPGCPTKSNHQFSPLHPCPCGCLISHQLSLSLLQHLLQGVHLDSSHVCH